MACIQELAVAVQQSAINDPDDAHLGILTFNYTNDEDMVDAVLSGSDGTALTAIRCLAPTLTLHKHYHVHIVLNSRIFLKYSFLCLLFTMPSLSQQLLWPAANVG